MLTFYDQNVWNHNPSGYRNGLIREIVKDMNADVCAFQEFGPNSTRQGNPALDVLMLDEYNEVCPELRDVTYTALFYKKDRFDLIDSGHFLYDGLNDCNSKSVTWAVLEDKETKKRFAAMSTHFWWNFVSPEDFEQRLQNVDQIEALCKEVIAKHNVPVIIGGDFNNGKDSEQGDEPYQKMLKKGFRDIRLTADKTTDSYTHHDYPEEKEDGTWVTDAELVRTLDQIFTYGEYDIKALEFDVLASQIALDSSDHCPLIGKFEF